MRNGLGHDVCNLSKPHNKKTSHTNQEEYATYHGRSYLSNDFSETMHRLQVFQSNMAPEPVMVKHRQCTAFPRHFIHTIEKATL